MSGHGTPSSASPGTVGGKKKTKPHVKLVVESTLLPSSPDGVKDVLAAANSAALSRLLQLVSHVSTRSRDTKLRRCQKIYRSHPNVMALAINVLI
eukprot:SAG31_NODE_15616_length_746_cov_1.530139_1_plen_94_part_01